MDAKLAKKILSRGQAAAGQQVAQQVMPVSQPETSPSTLDQAMAVDSYGRRKLYDFLADKLGAKRKKDLSEQATEIVQKSAEKLGLPDDSAASIALKTAAATGLEMAPLDVSSVALGPVARKGGAMVAKMSPKYFTKEAKAVLDLAKKTPAAEAAAAKGTVKVAEQAPEAIGGVKFYEPVMAGEGPSLVKAFDATGLEAAANQAKLPRQMGVYNYERLNPAAEIAKKYPELVVKKPKFAKTVKD
jgi:hypothetical protein